MAQPEVWLRGPLDGIPPLLQPVAHSLLQSREELTACLADLEADRVWRQPANAASIGFHVLHAAGSLDRLFTYARGEQLSGDQRAALAAENDLDRSVSGAALLTVFTAIVERALDQLGRTDERSLREPRGVGRAALPSTVMGLLFHAAEHTQRHAAQALTTLRLLESSSDR